MKSLNILKNMMAPQHQYRFNIKSWGFEYWFQNNKKYCGKILQVNPGLWSSHGAFHYHKVKDETFLILSGCLMLDILDLSRFSRYKIETDNRLQILEENAMPWVNRYYLREYNYMRLKPGVLHRFSAHEGEALFTETSTTHFEEDSFRILNPEPSEQMKITIEHHHLQNNFPVNTESFSYKYKLLEEEK